MMIVLVATAIGLLGFRRAASRQHKSIASFETRFENARNRVAKLDVLALDAEDRTVELIRGSVLAAVAVVEPSSADAIADAISEFFVRRYGLAPSEYASWRRDCGYVAISLDELRAHWFLEDAYRAYMGRDLPRTAGWDEVHNSLLEAQRSFEGGRLQIRGLAVGVDAVSAVTKRLTRTDPSLPPVAGLTGEHFEAGRSVSAGAPWWRPPLDADALMRRDGYVDVCVIGLFAEFGDGERRPIGVQIFRDPTSSRWWVASSFGIGVSRFGNVDGIRIEY